MATIKQKIAFKEVLNGSTISGAMVKAGYSATTATTTGKLTNTDGWQELLDKHLSDESLARHHRELLEARQPAYFVFPKAMEDEEIIGHVQAAGFEVIVVRPSDKGKLAFYSTVDSNAQKSAIDMGYKLKGHYAPEKQITLTATLLDVLTDLEHEKTKRTARKTKKIPAEVAE